MPSATRSILLTFTPNQVSDRNRSSGGTVPTISLSALIPKGSRNIIVAGRCVSSDRLANSGLRVQASCMGMGQAAGVAASLAAKADSTPLEVPLPEIHAMLREHGQIVPEKA